MFAGGVQHDGRVIVVDVPACRRWIALALSRLEATSGLIDALNVFPVPDGDTGTNLLLTLRRAAEEVRVAQATVAGLTRALADGALLGARGNSGIITAQMLAGCAEVFGSAPGGVVDGRVLAGALTRADELAWSAVELPVEGTVLSVTRAVAQALEPESLGQAVGTPEDALAVVRHASQVARQALAATTEQLPALREADVVDAGAAGFVLLLDALTEALSGVSAGALPGVDDADVGNCGASVSFAPHATVGPAYEVMFMLPEVGDAQALDDPIAWLRRELAGVGDSVVVAGLRPVHAHVHTDDPSAALRVARRFGAPADVRVVHLATGTARPVPLAPGGATDGEVAPVGCVAWASGPGLAGVIAAAGATPVVSSAAKRISTEEMVEAILGTGATEVAVLPNDADSLPVVRAAAARVAGSGVRARVVETFSEVQGLAAVAVFDPMLDPDELVAGMSAAAAGTRHGSVAVARRAASTPGGRCRPGDALGLVGGEIVHVGADVVEMAAVVLADLMATGEPELVTLVLGSAAPAGMVERVREVAGPAEIEVVAGGQQTYVVLLGVE